MVQDLSYNLCESLVENIGGVAGIGKKTPVPPQPIIYLTQWKMMGNSEVHGQEIWSCGEYSAVDGKYHILVQPQGGSIADIALDEPLRKVNDVADSIEFADGVATLTRNFASVDISTYRYIADTTRNGKYRFVAYNQPLPNAKLPATTSATIIMLCALYNTVTALNIYAEITGISLSSAGAIGIYDENYNESTSKDALMAHIQGAELIYELDTPTTETIQVPQIEEVDSYSCFISQGAKAVSWSSFETN